jgi:hypothetical protein
MHLTQPQLNQILPICQQRASVRLARAGVWVAGGCPSKPVNARAAEGETFQCAALVIVDGDTLRCGSRRVRLSGIDG